MFHAFKFHLTEASFNALEADNGKDAITVTMNTFVLIDLVITNLNTRIIDGLELVTKIAFEEYKNVPILLMTSDICTNTVFPKDALYACFRSLLTKPVPIMKRLKEVERIFLLP